MKNPFSRNRVPAKLFSIASGLLLWAMAGSTAVSGATVPVAPVGMAHASSSAKEHRVPLAEAGGRARSGASPADGQKMLAAARSALALKMAGRVSRPFSMPQQPSGALPMDTTSATVSTTWTSVKPSTAPAAEYSNMVYDAALGKVVLFGGLVNGTASNATWTFDGTNWVQLSVTGPSARYHQMMAYDAGHQTVVLFAGLDGQGDALFDTWTFDGSTWTNVSPTNSPGHRSQAAMAYDPATQTVVLFGGGTMIGSIDGSNLGDTWTWDGTAWTQQSPAASPAKRFGAAMAYDSTDEMMVLFGGIQEQVYPRGDPDITYYSDTWQWTGTNWKNLGPAHAPTPRQAAGLSDDPALGGLVLFGGVGDGPTYANDTWFWTGTDWSAATPASSPSTRANMGAAYVPSLAAAVLYGGMNGTTIDTDTLSFGAVAPPVISSITPATGTTVGGTNVTISGTNLMGTTKVLFGGASATAITSTATAVLATAPAGSAGVVDVVAFTTSGGSSAMTSTDQYTYAVPVPTIASLSPTNGTTAGGTTVTITGTNFTGTTSVTFGGVPVTSFTVVSATQLTVKTPAGIAGAAAVVVTTTYGSVTSTSGYAYETPPTVTGVSPARGSVNGQTGVTITGTDFTPSSTVLFGSAAPQNPIYYTNSTSIFTASPAHGAGTVDVVVSDGNASSAVSSLDQYTYGIPVPTLAVSHTGNAVAGGNLSYTVTAGVTGTTAEFGELNLASPLPMGVSFVSSSGNDWQCSGNYGGLMCTNQSSIAPGGSYPLSITLGFNSCAPPGVIPFSLGDAHNSYVNAVDPTNVTCATPTVTGITPATGPAAGGNAVTVTGTNFFAGATVSIGAQAATNVIVVNSTTLTATVPAYVSGAATTNVAVSTAGGNGLLVNGYTYTFPMATTTSITPNSGPTAGGTLVTLSGANLSYVQSVTFGTAAAAIDSDSATSIVVTAPAHAAAGAVSINLTFPTGVVGIAGGYTYVPSQLVVTSAADDGTTVAANCTPQAVAGTGTDANCRLRDAVAVANANPGSTITFDATKFGAQQTITLASTLALTANMTIHGPGQALLSVSGGNAVRIATIASAINVAIDSMTLTLGTTTSLGGAVQNNEGTFSATLVTFSNNAAAQGGAIQNENNPLNGTSGTVRIDQCIFLNNTASQDAGAIENFGTLRITNSTFLNNSAALADSAIGSFGVTLTVINSTFTNNSGASSAGSAAVDSEDTTVTVVNNTFSGNSGGGTGTPDLSVDASTKTVNNNLFLEGSSAQFAGGIGNVLGSTVTLLANYGGSTQTMLPIPGSAAICAGSVANIYAGSTTDQRGLARTTTYGANAACVDAGAVQTHYAASWNPQPTNVLVGATMTPAPAVTITESGVGYAGIGTTLGLSTAGPTLSGGTATTIASGAATYSALSLNQAVTGETLLLPISIANGLAYSVASAAFNVTVPVPTLTSVNPNSGSTAGGNAVTLTGTSLTGATSVTIGGIAATLGANTGTTLLVLVPAYVSGALTKNVVLTTPGGSVSLTNAYTYTAVTPAIVSVTPNMGQVAGGTLVTITGTGFVPGTTVSFGARSGTAATVVNSTTLTVTTPAYVGGSLAVDVVVNNGAGIATLANGYTYVALLPAVTSVSPSSGPALGGTTVTISGTNFLSGTTVSFGGVAATRVTVVSASSITAVSPAGTGVVDVTVTSGGQTSATSSADHFTYAADTITAAATNVGSTSASYQVTFVFTATTTLNATASTAIKVLTQGAAGLDFTQASGGSCAAGATYQAGDSCTVLWTLHPYAPGLRVGAIELLNSSGAIVSSRLVSGVGVGPLASVDPAVMSTVVPGSNITNLGIGVDAQGNVYYYNGDAGALFEVAAGTSVSTRIYTTSDTVRHVAVDGAGNLYLAGSAVIVKLAAGTFTPTTLATGINTSQGIVVDAAGNVYAGDTGHTRVIEMPASNQVCGAACPTVGSGFADVRGLAINSTGTIYVAERSAQRISQVIGGVRSNFLTGLTNGPDELMVDGGDAVYVFFNSEDTQKYSAAGALLQDLLTTIGSAGAPSDLAMDGLGNIYSAVGGSGEHGEVAKYTRTALAGSTPTVDFGSVAAGTTSAAMTVALSNSGNSTLSAVAPGIAVAPTDFVSVTTGTGVCGTAFSLTAGGVCQLSAEFAPATTDTGAKTGAATITDNSLNASPSATQSVTLTGIALPQPTGTSLAPASGTIAGGTSVTVMGTNFTGATSVTFGGVAATLGTVTATSITVMTPAHAAGAVDVAVTTPGGTTTLSAAYTYIGASNVSVTPVTVTYGSATADLSATYTYLAGYPPANGFTFTIGTGSAVAASCSATSTTSESCTAAYPVAGLSVAGSPYTITGALAADINYPASSSTASLTITKAAAKVTFTSSTLTQTYTGSALSAAATVTPSSIPPSELSYTYAGTGATSYPSSTTPPTNAGTYSVSASLTDASYTGSAGPLSFTITPAALTATAGSYSGVYDGNTHALSACVIANNSGGLICTNNPAGPVGPNVSSGSVVPVVSGAGGNYTITSVNGSYSITQASSITTVTCPANVIYTGAAQTPCTAAVTGAGSLSQSLTVTYTLNTNVGTATASATFSGDANHIASTKSTTFAISAATLTATAGSYSGVYDGNTHSLSACVIANNPGGISCTNNPVGPVGPDVSSGVVVPVISGVEGNFSVTSVNGSYSITQASSTTTLVCPASVIYTGAAQTPCTATVTGAGGLSQSLTVTYTLNTNVGTATASATFAGDVDHTASNKSITFSIVAATLTATAGSYSGVYDGTTHALSACVIANNPGGLACTNNPAGPVGPGVSSGVVVPVISGPTGNYTVTSVNGAYSIAQAPSTTILTCPPSVIYTGSAQMPCTASVTGVGGLSQSLPVTYTLNTNVGTATATAAFLGDTDHTASNKSITFSIVAATLTATAGSYSGVYDGNTHALSACVIANSPGGLTCTNNPAGPVGPGVSSGTVIPVISGASGNYTVTSVNGAYAITQASSTTTVTCPASVVYTGSAQTPCTATVSGAGGLSQSLTVSYTLNTNVGTATASATFSGDTNHTASTKSTTFAITTATLTATAGSYNGVYDGNTHALSACVIANNPGGLTCTNNPVGPIGPGVSSGAVVPVISGATGNYTVNSVNGAYAITQASSTTTLSCPASVIYTGSAQTPCTAMVTGAGGLSQSLAVTYALNTNVGTATASATFTGDVNHTSSTKSTTFAITPAMLTATAGSYSGVYDGKTHALSACVISNNPGGLTCANNPAGPVGPDVGSAVVAPVVSGAAGNYTVTLVNGAWSITALPVTVTAGSYTGTYDGATHAPSACISSYAGVTCTNTPTPIGPGISSGAVTPVVAFATGFASDYTVTAVKGSYSITAAMASVTPNAAGKLYGAADPTLTGTLSGFLPADNVTATYTRVAGEMVAGSPYAISAVLSPAAVLSNYTITYNHAAFTINKAPVLVSLSASNQQVNPYQNVTLSSTVASTTSGTPAGSVTFLDNGSILATVGLTNGSASYSTTALTPAQVAVITVTYSGDPNFLSGAGNSSVPITVGALDFTFSTLGYTSYSVAPGLIASYTFQAAPLFTNYAGPVSFAVTGLPPGATATFTPTSVGAAGGTQSIVMSVQTRAPIGRNERHSPFEKTLPLFALLFLPLLGSRRLRRKMDARMLTVLLLLAGLGGTAALTGCGAGSGFLLETPATYTLNVTATAGTIQHSQTVTLIVQ